MEGVVANTTRNFGFVKYVRVTFIAVFGSTFFASPFFRGISTKIIEVSFIKSRAMKMMPERTFVTADAVLVINRKGFIAINTVFIGASLATPGFIRIFFVLFNRKIV